MSRYFCLQTVSVDRFDSVNKFRLFSVAKDIIQNFFEIGIVVFRLKHLYIFKLHISVVKTNHITIRVSNLLPSLQNDKCTTRVVCSCSPDIWIDDQ